MFFFAKPNKSGQGLVETVVALGIIIAALTAGIGLAVSSLIGSEQTLSMVVATNLAREGIEVVRNVRDTNWLTPANTWNAGLTSAADATATTVFNPATGAWTIDFTPNDLAGCTADKSCKLYVGDDYAYTHTPAGRQETMYSRLLTLNKVCQDGQILSECPPINPQIGFEVVSTVFWNERGRDHTVVIKEYLYNWK